MLKTGKKILGLFLIVFVLLFVQVQNSFAQRSMVTEIQDESKKRKKAAKKKRGKSQTSPKQKLSDALI